MDIAEDMVLTYGRGMAEDMLMTHIMRGETERVQFYIRNCKNLNFKNEWGYTPLLTAIEKGNYRISQILLQLGADPNTNGNFTELHYARGLPRSNELFEWTPLINAALCDQPEILELLIDYGADLDYRDIKGRSALTAAINWRRPKCAEILILNGAKVSVSELKSAELLCPSLDIKSILTKARMRNKVENHQKVPTLHSAAEDGDHERLRELLTQGANINKIDHKGQTALHITIEKDNKQCTEFLLMKGADTNILNAQGELPLHIAVRVGGLEIISLLARSGANVNATDASEIAPLHLSIVSSQPLCAKMLLQLGADVHNRFPCGMTSLHWALKEMDKPCIDLLVKEHADIFAIDSRGATPLDIAASISPKMFMSLLQGNVNITNSKGLTPIHFATAYPLSGCLEILIKKGANVNAQTYRGDIPLHTACLFGNTEMRIVSCKVLLKNGADINRQNIRGCSPIFAAVSSNLSDCTKLLIKHGAIINEQNEMRQTPLHYACAKGGLKIIETLLEHGTEINAVDKEQHTPLLLAAKGAHFYCVKLLLKHGAFLWGKST